MRLPTIANCLLLLAAATVRPDTSRPLQLDDRFPLFAALTGTPPPTLVAYAPSGLDPRRENGHRDLTTESIRADLEALRPAFDGLVLYGYHEASTPRVLEVAKELGFRVVLLAVWDVKSEAELDGVCEIAGRHEGDFALGVIVGNEGITFNRYTADDLAAAGKHVRDRLPATIPMTTSEPLAGYQHAFVREFGDFLAPNIHPVFDRPDMGADDAAAWAREQTADLARQTGKPVLLKETGFPHGGKEPYTPDSQKAFWSAYLRPGLLHRPDGAAGEAADGAADEAAGAWTFHGVAFEAFDLAWKAEASGIELEKSWGLLSDRREAHPALEVWRQARESADAESAQAPERR